MLQNLDAIRALLAKGRQRLIEAADSTADDRWLATPRPGAWSAGEVVTHTMQVEESIIARSRKILGKPPRPVPLLKRLRLPLILATTRARKLESPIPLDPARILAKPIYAEKIAATREVTLAFIAETAGRDLTPYNFPHPLFGPLNLYDWLRLIAYHEIRHAKQIREVAEIFQR